MRNQLPASLAAAALCLSAAAQSAQIGPSVLDLQRSYHVGIYSATIDVPSGAILLLAQNGGLDLTAGGGVIGALDTWEWTALGGTFTPNDPLLGEYFVAPDGRIEFDFDLQNPGTDVFEAWIDPDGAAMHVARYDLDAEAISVLALAKSTGQSNASLNGTYRFYGQRLELAGASYETTAEHGTVTFDGSGNASFAVTELFVASNGATATTTSSGTAGYAVAADGALTFASGVGGIDATGEVFFVMTASTTSSEVGMMVGVRVGSGTSPLDGTYTYHAQGHELGPAASLPRTATDIGRLQLTATSATTGGYQVTGTTFFGNAAGQSSAVRTVVGQVAMTSNGVVTLAGGPPIELAFSASGRYAVGRAVDNRSDLWFAARGCAESTDYGTATAGSGGIEPELGMRTFPTLGNAGWRFAVVDGLGGAPAILALGFVPVVQGWPFAGGLLWLDPLQIVAAPFVPLGGAAGVAGAGFVDVSLPVPTHPSFDGLTLFAQALVLDPGAPASVAMSRGFRAVFSR